MSPVVVSVLEVDRVDASRLAAFWTTLSRMEREEADRVADRRSLVCARALVRLALSAEVPAVAPEAWTFARDDAGKPRVTGPIAAGPAFNLSHTDGLAVCGVSAAPLGVDAEPLANAAAILDTVVRSFAEIEVAALRALAPADRLRRAVELWTVKEAYVKGLGTGIARHLDRFAVRPGDADPSRWIVDEDARWSVVVRDQGRFLIAVATVGAPAIVFRDVLPA